MSEAVFRAVVREKEAMLRSWPLSQQAIIVYRLNLCSLLLGI